MKQLSDFWNFNNHKDSSLSAAVFVWTVENTGSQDVHVSIMFTFKNGQGTKEDKAGGVTTSHFRSAEDSDPVSGVMVKQKFRDMPCTYNIAAKETVK